MLARQEALDESIQPVSLLAFQIELAGLIGASTRMRSADLPPEDRLQGAEVACLARVSEGRGLAFTRGVRRSWCLMRTCRVAQLTLSVLPLEVRRAALNAWVDAGGGASSFFAGEAEAFLEFLAQRLPDPSHELSLCRFEQAIHRAMGALSGCRPLPDEVRMRCRLRVRAGASLVSLFGDPKDVLVAVGAGRCLPPMSERPVRMLFAPGIPSLWRHAGAPEVRVFEKCAAAGARGVPAPWRTDAATVRRLLGEGVLEVVGPMMKLPRIARAGVAKSRAQRRV
jgi:hypothetical protein